MGDSGKKYHAIFIPPENYEVSNDVSTVVVDFKAVVEILKRNPGARFRAASTITEAWSYLWNGKCPFEDEGTPPEQSDEVTPPEQSDEVTPPEQSDEISFDTTGEDVENSSEERRRQAFFEQEKANEVRFPTPKPYQLFELRQAVQQQQNGDAIALMESNPKFLVNHCDHPTIVHIGCYLNILHIAARENNAEIISYVLNKVGSREFMVKLYPQKNREEIDRLIIFVTDCYLNTPDKVAYETPLHVAAKFFAFESVGVLISHPWTKLDAVNFKNKTAVQIIGTRDRCIDYVDYIKMSNMFENNWYIVPIWRNSFGCCLPQIGPIAQIRDLKACTPPSLMKSFPDFDVKLLGPCEQSLTPKKQEIGQLPFENSSWKIEAYAGPTSKIQAEKILAVIKSESRLSYSSDTSEISTPPSTPASSQNDYFPHSPILSPSLFHSTPNRRRSLGNLSFEQSFTSSGNKNNGSVSFLSSALDLSYHRRTDIEKGLERHARQIAMDYNVQWVEYWKFLHFFGDIMSDEGLSYFEQFLKSKESELDPVLNISVDSDDDNNSMSLEEWLEHFLQESNGDVAKIEKYSVDEPDSKDDDSVASFHSAKSDESNEELFVDCRDQVFFIDGEKPGKSDRQVFALLKEYENKIPADKYPLVFQWLSAMQLDENKSVVHDVSELANSLQIN